MNPTPDGRIKLGKKSSIRTKLLVFFLLLSLIPAIAIGIFSFFSSQSNITRDTYNSLDKDRKSVV